MPTISQLPSAGTVSASDLIPISQGGSAHAVSIGALLAQTQPAIMVAPPSLLGRTSVGPGGPDAIAIGDGLVLNNGTLTATTFDASIFPAQTNLSTADQIIVTNAGALLSVGLTQLRELFTAGSNVTIDQNGVIAASMPGNAETYSLTSLSAVASLASEDLIGVSQRGQDHNITYSNLIDGVTINEGQPANLATDNDTFWVAQSNNIMLRQTLGALWPWISGKLPLWRQRVVELTVNTTLDGSLHNNSVLVCNAPIVISAAPANLGAGFHCELINVSSGPVTFSGNIIVSNGSDALSSFQCSTIFCVTYSGGTMIFASVSTCTSATAVPGQTSGLMASSVGSTSITLSWSPPASGGAVSVYMVQYRVTGTQPWIFAGQTNGSTSFVIAGLQASATYDYTVSAMNNVGSGPTSSAITAATAATSALPGSTTAVSIGEIAANSMTCSWTAPTIGGAPLVYTVQYSLSGQGIWTSAASNLSATMFNITNLQPATAYDIQIIASNSTGSGPSSIPVTATTIPASGLVTSITWALAPIGSFSHGIGAIGVNAHVNPAAAQVQFGTSTSLTVPPTTWVTATHVNTDFWGAYVPTPASVGAWYGWVEGTDGSAPTVYPTPFTVT